MSYRAAAPAPAFAADSCHTGSASRRYGCSCLPLQNHVSVADRHVSQTNSVVAGGNRAGSSRMGFFGGNRGVAGKQTSGIRNLPSSSSISFLLRPYLRKKKLKRLLGISANLYLHDLAASQWGKQRPISGRLQIWSLRWSLGYLENLRFGQGQYQLQWS